jgi:uncharacterized protein
MAKLLEQINSDLKAAMIAKDAVTLSCLRMLITALRNKEITIRHDGKAELSDEQIIETIGSEIKKRRDSIEAYLSGGRQDLVDKETAEIKIMEKYMPAQLADEELEKIIKEIIDASGDKNFGKIMGQAMAKVKGKADGKKVGEIVKKLLA